MTVNEMLKPKEIVAELDRYIIGQDQAKRMVAIAVRNRVRRLNVQGELKDDIIPSNIIMAGPTGVGKTEIARRLAMLVNAPFVKVEATKFTEVGYVGKDVESIIRDLMNASVSMTEKKMMTEVEESSKKAIERQILEYIVPGFDSTELQTKQKFRDMLKDGLLEDREIEIEVSESSPKVDIFGIGGMDAFEPIQEMISTMTPKKSKKKKMKVSDARNILLENEMQKRIDRDKLVEDAKWLAENHGIVFIDEIDKIISTGKYEGAEVSRSGVQRDLLPIVEGTNVMTKWGQIKTDHILFISAGAFTGVSVSDLMPELQGRFPVRVELSQLTKDDFFRILTDPHNAITKQYTELMKTEGVEIKFHDDALEYIADVAFSVNRKIEDIGARRLRTILTRLLENIMFDAPDTEKKIDIDRKYAEMMIGGMFEEIDAKKYIL